MKKPIDNFKRGCYNIDKFKGIEPNDNKQAAATAKTGEMHRKDEVIMKFTFEEWKFIQHCIECAGREFEKMMLDSTPSDKETSCYQIFKRQTEKANALVEKIKGSEI